MKLKIRHKLFLIFFLSSAVLFGSFVDWAFIDGNQPLWFYLNNYATNIVFHFDDKEKEFTIPAKTSITDNLVTTGMPLFFEPRGIWARAMLFDSRRKWLVGGAGDEVAKRLHWQVLRGEEEIISTPPETPEGKAAEPLKPKKIWTEFSELQPVRAKGKVVGYVALLPIPEVSLSRDYIFFHRQETFFLLLALGAFAFTAATAFPLTSHLVEPIRELASGTRRLISGNFKARIPVTRSDELGQLSQDFNVLAAALERNEADRRQWVADISHELRTPLSVLRGEIEAMQDGIRTFDDKALEILHGEVMHLSRLTGDLYELSCSDLGALTYSKSECSPLGILEGVVEAFSTRFEESGLDLNLKVERSGRHRSLRMLADPGRLQQLFTNLLENSRRYTKSPGRLDIRAKVEGRRLVLVFSDTAPGVRDENLPKLFDRLFRGDASRTWSGLPASGRVGSGLGLSICKNVVEAHEGKITAGHSADGGLEMTIELPVL